MVNIDTIKNNLEEQMEESYLMMIDTKSSAGMLYLHLLGTIIADDRIKINQINTYQNPFVVAKAKVMGYKVVSTEVYKNGGAKVPNLCEYEGVQHLSVQDFMKEENWKF